MRAEATSCRRKLHPTNPEPRIPNPESRSGAPSPESRVPQYPMRYDRPMESVRLDIWLDIACLFRTRSEAQKACKAGRVDVNGQEAKPHREIRSGDEIVISRPLGRKQRIVVAMRWPTSTSRARKRVVSTKT